MYVLNSVINLMLEKMKNNRYTNWFFAAAVVVAGFSMAAATSVLRSFSSTGSLVMLIQPSSSGSERKAAAFSALTGCGADSGAGVGS